MDLISNSIHLFDYQHFSDESKKEGTYYWGVTLDDGRDVYIWADRLEVSPNGDLIAMSHVRAEDTRSKLSSEMPFMSIANGKWVSFWKTLLMDGKPISLHNAAPYSEQPCADCD